MAQGRGEVVIITKTAIVAVASATMVLATPLAVDTGDFWEKLPLNLAALGVLFTTIVSGVVVVIKAIADIRKDVAAAAALAIEAKVVAVEAKAVAVESKVAVVETKAEVAVVKVAVVDAVAKVDAVMVNRP